MKENTPIYKVIVKEIREEIENGILKPGQKLPSERELCRRYDVARGTLKAAISHLKQLGLLEQARGSGTYVRQKGEGESFYKNAEELVEELAGMHMTKEEIILMAGEIMLGKKTPK